MEYTVQKLAKIAGVSSRTLRYYDEIKILKPARINSSGYRIYGEKELDMLQQILFYRELGVNLQQIKTIVTSPNFDRITTLKEHRINLLEKRKQLDLLVNNVDQSIAEIERGIKMNKNEKFKGFKQKLIEDNETKYGKEIRKKYSDEVINKSNDKLKNMTQGEYDDINVLEEKILDMLNNAFETGDPAGDLAQKTADLHRQWLTFYWDSYTKAAHTGVAQMYVDDERFTEYYDKKQPGLAKFLRDAVFIYTEIKK